MAWPVGNARWTRPPHFNYSHHLQRRSHVANALVVAGADWQSTVTSRDGFKCSGYHTFRADVGTTARRCSLLLLLAAAAASACMRIAEGIVQDDCLQNTYEPRAFDKYEEVLWQRSAKTQKASDCEKRKCQNTKVVVNQIELRFVRQCLKCLSDYMYTTAETCFYCSALHELVGIIRYMCRKLYTTDKWFYVGPTIFPQGPKFLSVPGPPNLYFNHCISHNTVIGR